MDRRVVRSNLAPLFAVQGPLGKREFIAAVRASRQRLLDEIGDPARCDLTRRVDANWTLHDMLGHLSAYDHAVIAALSDARAGRKVVWDWRAYESLDAWNAAQTDKRRAWTRDALVTEWLEARAQLLDALDAFADDDPPFGADSWDIHKSPVSWLTDHDSDHAKELPAS